MFIQNQVIEKQCGTNQILSKEFQQQKQRKRVERVEHLAAKAKAKARAKAKPKAGAKRRLGEHFAQSLAKRCCRRRPAAAVPDVPPIAVVPMPPLGPAPSQAVVAAPHQPHIIVNPNINRFEDQMVQCSNTMLAERHPCIR